MPAKKNIKLFKHFHYALLLFFTYTSAQHIVSKNDSIHLYSYEILDSLARKNYFSNPALSKKYAEISLRKAQLDDNDERVTNALLRIAMMEGQFERFEKAHQLLDSALFIVKEKLQDINKIHDYKFFKGNLYYEAGDLSNALQHYIAVKKFKKGTNDRTYDRDINHNIAMIKSNLGDKKEAIQLLKENYVFYKQKAEKEGIHFHATPYLSTIILLNSIYIKAAYSETNQTIKTTYIDSALHYTKIGFAKSKFYKEKESYNHFVYGKASICFLQEKYTDAIKSYLEALETAKKIPQKSLLPFIYIYLGKSYEKLDDVETALTYFKKINSLEVPKEKSLFFLPTLYASLSDIYIKKRDTINATKYLNLLTEAQKKTSLKKYEVTELMHENHDIPLLKDKIKTLAEGLRYQKDKLTLSTVFILFLVIVFLSFFFYNKKKKQQNQLKFQKLIEELKETQKQEVATIIKSKSIHITEEKVAKILKALDTFEQKKQFLDVNCDLAFVAKKVKTNKAYLSKVIHAEKQQKFIQYITNLRINYALEKLKEDKLFRSYDIKSIAAELGFKSPDSFSRAFKNKTGIYPSYYIKNINKINGSEDI